MLQEARAEWGQLDAESKRDWATQARAQWAYKLRRQQEAEAEEAHAESVQRPAMSDNLFLGLSSKSIAHQTRGSGVHRL